MTYPDTGYQCHRCGMRFAVVAYFNSTGEIAICSEPKCTTRFHHGIQSDDMVHCEVLRSDMEEQDLSAADRLILSEGR